MCFRQHLFEGCAADQEMVGLPLENRDAGGTE